MTKKINFKDKKGFKFKFEAAVTIGGHEFKKDKEFTLSLDDKTDEEIDVKHDTVVPTGKFTGKIKQEKDSENPGDVEKEVEFSGKFDKGYFWDSFDIAEVKDKTDTSKSGKLAKVISVKTGADLLGINYWGWGGIAAVLLLIGVGGYYWWTSYNKEEEEENL